MNKYFLLLHIIIAFYSLGGVFTKFAGRYSFLSVGFCLCYGAVICILGVYAICWQQIIKRIPLTTAFANKAFTVIWGLIFGVVFFQESITVGKIIGIAMIVLGVVLFVSADKETENVE